MDYITKPFNTEDVLTRVASHIRINNFKQQLEDELRQCQALTRLSLEGILIHDSGLILDVNLRALEVLGGTGTNPDTLRNYLTRWIPSDSFILFEKDGQKAEVHLIITDKLQSPVDIFNGSVCGANKKIGVIAVHEVSGKLPLGRNKTCPNILGNRPIKLNLPGQLSDYSAAHVKCLSSIRINLD